MIVLSDTFTVGADTNLGAYGNWQVTLGAAGDLRVEESTDRVETVTASADLIYRWNGASTPTSGRVTADLHVRGALGDAAAQGWCSLAGRLDANGNGYLASWAPFEGDIVIYRVTSNGGTFTEIARSAGQIVNGATTYTNAYLEITGTGATVAISAGDDTNGANAVTFNDTDAARHTTGLFGLHMFCVGAAQLNGGATPAWIDNLDIDDLQAGGGGEPSAPAGGSIVRISTGYHIRSIMR